MKSLRRRTSVTEATRLPKQHRRASSPAIPCGSVKNCSHFFRNGSLIPVQALESEALEQHYWRIFEAMPPRGRGI